jgi:hypothetical protein
MNNAIPIHSYHDLIKEEQRLILLSAWQKDQLREDVQDFKKQLAPVARIASFVGHLAAPVKKNPLLGAGVGMGASLLAEKAIGTLRPVKWLAGIAAPFLLKKAIGLLGRSKAKKPGV